MESEEEGNIEKGESGILDPCKETFKRVIECVNYC